MNILSNELSKHYEVASLQRGHSVFTSFISKNGQMLFLESHLERLLTGADFLFPNVEWTSQHEKLKQYIESEFSKLNRQVQNSGYFRLTIFDDNIYLQHRELLSSPDALKLSSAFKMKSESLLPAFVKFPNYVESDLELIRAKFKEFDDVVFFDHDQNVTEATTSNIFMVTPESSILTPPPSSMILDGITRKKLFQKLKENGFSVHESAISKTDLLKAQEIWLTNSVKGIRFVSQFEDLKFEKKNSMFEKAIEIFGRYGELA